MADVFTVLAQDHEEVKGMLAELEQGPARATELDRKITDGKKTAPTRPHPHTPASPGVLKAAGPAAAAADKARDAVTGRGTG